MSDNKLTTSTVKNTTANKLTRRKKKKRKKRKSLWTKRKVRSTTSNIRIPLNIQCVRKKSQWDRFQHKKRLKSEGHNVDNLPWIDYNNPIEQQHLCTICGNQFFKTNEDLLSHISSNHNSKNTDKLNGHSSPQNVLEHENNEHNHHIKREIKVENEATNVNANKLPCIVQMNSSSQNVFKHENNHNEATNLNANNNYTDNKINIIDTSKLSMNRVYNGIHCKIEPHRTVKGTDTLCFYIKGATETAVGIADKMKKKINGLMVYDGRTTSKHGGDCNACGSNDHWKSECPKVNAHAEKWFKFEISLDKASKEIVKYFMSII